MTSDPRCIHCEEPVPIDEALPGPHGWVVCESCAGGGDGFADHFAEDERGDDGTEHDALDDAIHQAERARRTLRRLEDAEE